MLDDILDLFQRSKRQRGASRSSSDPQSGLPFDLPFLDQDDEDDEQDSRRQDRRKPGHRPNSGRSATDGDRF